MATINGVTTRYSYTINTDAGITRGIMAQDRDEAIRLFTSMQSGPGSYAGACDTWEEYADYIEGIEGAWAWIEAEDHPTECREYAGEMN